MGSPFAEAFRHMFLSPSIRSYWIGGLGLLFAIGLWSAGGPKGWGKHCDPLLVPVVAALAAVALLAPFALFFYVLDLIAIVLSSCPSPAPC